MADRIEGGIVGGLGPFVGVDVYVATTLADVTLASIQAGLLTAPTGGAVTVELRDAGAALATVTIADGALSGAFTGAVAIASGTPLSLRVTAAPGVPSDLRAALGFDADLALTTVARVKDYRRITTAAHDGLLAELVEGVSRVLEGYVGRPLVQRSHTAERRRGNGWHELVLDNFPVIGTPVVRLDGSTLAAGTDFRVRPEFGVLERLGGDDSAWIGWEGDVEVDYVSGYATIPADLRLAATKQAAHEFAQATPGGGRLGLTATSAERGGQASYEPDGLLPSVRAVLDGYREIAPHGD